MTIRCLPHPRRPARLLASLSLGALCALSACGDDAQVPSSHDAAMSAAAPAPPPVAEEMAMRVDHQRLAVGAGGMGGAANAANAAPPVAPSSPAAAGGQPLSGDAPGTTSSQPAASAIPTMVIRTGAASVKVDSLEPAIAAVRAMATALGGFVGTMSQSGGENEVRRATIELKIPAARYDEAMSGLRPIGEIESAQSTAEDVGEEFVDVTARVANARRLEERLIVLLATRTGKLEEVLAVERELARVREEIERYEGRLRYLRTRAALSTLTVTVHEPGPILGNTPGYNPIAEAFRAAWRNFVSFMAALIASLGILIPAGVLVVTATIGLRRWRRARGEVKAPLPPMSTGAP